MKFHVISHTVVEADPRDIYGMLSEHLDKLREMGTIESISVEHGRLEHAGDSTVRLQRGTGIEPVMLIAPDAYRAGGSLGKHASTPLSARELRRLAADAVSLAEFIDTHAERAA